MLCFIGLVTHSSRKPCLQVYIVLISSTLVVVEFQLTCREGCKEICLILGTGYRNHSKGIVDGLLDSCSKHSMLRITSSGVLCFKGLIVKGEFRSNNHRCISIWSKRGIRMVIAFLDGVKMIEVRLRPWKRRSACPVCWIRGPSPRYGRSMIHPVMHSFPLDLDKDPLKGSYARFVRCIL